MPGQGILGQPSNAFFGGPVLVGMPHPLVNFPPGANPAGLNIPPLPLVPPFTMNFGIGTCLPVGPQPTQMPYRNYHATGPCTARSVYISDNKAAIKAANPGVPAAAINALLDLNWSQVSAPLMRWYTRRATRRRACKRAAAHMDRNKLFWLSTLRPTMPAQTHWTGIAQVGSGTASRVGMWVLLDRYDQPIKVSSLIGCLISMVVRILAGSFNACILLDVPFEIRSSVAVTAVFPVGLTYMRVGLLDAVLRRQVPFSTSRPQSAVFV